MIALERTVVVLLCAGLSRRYGVGNKLLALLDDKPLVTHAAELCATIPFAGKIAVVPPRETELHGLLSSAGFDLVINSDPASGKDCSIRLGLAAAQELGARGALILLGDMPHVTQAHLRRLSAKAQPGDAAISKADDILSPPVLMSAETAERVISRDDCSVRTCLGRPIAVAATRVTLADYDYPEQFSAPPVRGSNVVTLERHG